MQLSYRLAALELDTRDHNSISATLSTDQPVDMPYGKEVLVHSPDAVNLTRAKDGLPLLWQHNADEIIGRVSNIRLESGRLRGDLRAGNSLKAKELWADVNDGILRDISVGYSVDEIPTRTGDQYIVNRWTIYEASLVSIGADQQAVIGRNKQNQKIYGGIKMSNDNNNSDHDQQPEDGWKTDKYEERARVTEILALGVKHKCEDLSRHHIAAGTSLATFRLSLLERIGIRTPAICTADPCDIGMSEKETSGFSFTRALRAMMTNNRSEAPFEYEASRAVEQRIGKKAQGLFVPGEVLQARALTKGTAADGGYTIATDLLASSFIEILRNQTQVITLGATMLNGLVGDVAIPKQTGAAAAYWLAEGADITLSQQAFGQVTMSPKTLAARTQYTRKLLLQATPAIESIVRGDLARVLAIELDRAAVNGTGLNNQPTGILATTGGIGVVAIGTNGDVPTWGHIVDMIGTVEQANVIGNGFLTNAKVKAKLSKTFTNSTYGDDSIWQPGTNGGGMLAGYQALVSGNVPANLTKGTGSALSAIIFGNWADLLIGQWGPLDLLLDPYTLAASGGMQVRCMLELDIAVRHAESFSIIKDAVTV